MWAIREPQDAGENLNIKLHRQFSDGILMRLIVSRKPLNGLQRVWTPLVGVASPKPRRRYRGPDQSVGGSLVSIS